MRSIVELRHLAFACVVMGASPLSAHAETDVIVFTNGDRLTCEIRLLERGRLTVKTDTMGTVSVKWDKVARVESDYLYRFETQSGSRYVGLPRSDKDGTLITEGDCGSSEVDVQRVPSATPIETTSFERLQGKTDAGYDFTQASTATTWSVNAAAEYAVETYLAEAYFSSNTKRQEGAENTNRENLNLGFTRYLGNRWSLGAIGQFESSENLDLDFRGLGGAPAGLRLVQSNRTRATLLGVAAFSREKFKAQEALDSNFEAVGALDVQLFRFDTPELDISGRVVGLPSLTTIGRFRARASAKAIELIKDFYFSINLYNQLRQQTSQRHDEKKRLRRQLGSGMVVLIPVPHRGAR